MTSEVYKHSLLSQVLIYVKVGHHVLDLGAGGGKQARAFSDAGAMVTAVDQRVIDEKGGNVKWRKQSIEVFVNTLTPDDHFDIIFTQNVFQFLDRSYVVGSLIPALKEHCATGGLCAIRTFFKEPKPPFDRLMTSFYTPEDLQSRFGSWNIILARSFEATGPDLHGIQRKFFLADVILRKP